MTWNDFTSHIKDIAIVILVIVCAVLLFSTTCTSQKNRIYKNNIDALRDSVHIEQLKNGELIHSKQMLILEKKQIEDYLDIANKEIKEIEKKLQSKIAYIAKLEGQIKVDTIRLVDSVYVKDSTYYSQWTFQDQWLYLQGLTQFKDGTSISRLNNLEMDVPLKLGIMEDNQVFVTSSNPYVGFSAIDGAALNKPTKKSYWNIGFQLGFGIQYDLRYNNFGYGPYLGIGGSWGWCF